MTQDADYIAPAVQYSCDPEYGDTPQGARIEQCKRWYAESKGKN